MKEATTRGSSRVPVYSYFLDNNAVLCTCCAQLFRAFPAATYRYGEEVLQRLNHNGTQTYWSFTASKISLQLLPMFEDENMLSLDSNDGKFNVSIIYKNDRAAIIS